MSISRRTALGIGLATGAATLAGCARPERATWAEPAGASGPSGSASDASALGMAGNPTSPAPASAGHEPAVVRGDAPYRAKLVEALTRYLKPTRENPKHPTYAGAVALVSVGGEVTAHVAVGHALRYGAGPVDLPAGKRVAMRPDSIFDLASITKMYVAILLLQQADKGRIDLAAPVVDYLPGFTGAGKAAVTVQMLLTHTSGLSVGAKVSGLPDEAARRKAVLATPLVAGAVPGRTFRYSSVGLMVAAQLVEKVTGQRLDQALRTGITGPLGLRDTGYKPLTWLSAAGKANRLVATDARTSRGLLRGVVHDDVTNIIGGIGGSAGIFSSAADLAVIGQALCDGGVYGGKRLLAEATVRKMLTNLNPGLPVVDAERPNRPPDHGLGVTLNQPWFMGRLMSKQTFGHTGFTGTSLLVHPGEKLVLVLLTNRAHPNWSWANPDPVRVAVANIIADAL